MADVGDLVLLYMNEQPTSFARIEEIAPDSKKGWCQVHLLLLQLPIVQVTWILKREYIDGSEFTMNGRRMRVELVKPPEHRDRSVSDS